MLLHIIWCQLSTIALKIRISASDKYTPWMYSSRQWFFFFTFFIQLSDFCQNQT